MFEYCELTLSSLGNSINCDSLQRLPARFLDVLHGWKYKALLALMAQFNVIIVYGTSP